MQAYILRRVVQGILAIFVICTVTFALARVSGDPLNVLLPEEASEEQIELIKAEWGLDKPLHMQYLQYLGKLFRGDLGEAIAWPNSTATELIVQRLPNTIKLSALALIVSGVIAFPVGVLVAIKKDTPFDYGGKLFAILGQSAPTFAVGLILMWIFAVQLNIFPTSGSGGIEYIILPALALGYYNVAALMRLTRSSMLEVLDTEYVKLARIKGVPE